MSPVLQLEDIAFVRGGEQILAGIRWTVQPGEHWVMIGPNGSGKSTLISFLCGYQWPTKGTVQVLGQTYGTVDLRQARARLGVFQPAQQAGIDVYHPAASAYDIILTGADGSLARYNDYTEAQQARARELFRTYFAGRASFPETRLFRNLSSGERRKVLLLRVFMAAPELLIFDEPYESLDIPSRLELESILVDYVRSHGVPALTVLHRVEEIPEFVTHVIMVKAGQVFAAGPLNEMMQAERLSHLYDVPLVLGREQGRYYCVPERRP